MLKQLSSLSLCFALMMPMSAEAAASSRRSASDSQRVNRILNRTCLNASIKNKARCLSRQQKRQSVGDTTSASANASYKRLNITKQREIERLNRIRSNTDSRKNRSLRRLLRPVISATDENDHRTGTRSIIKHANSQVNKIRETRSACMDIVSRRARSHCLDGIANSIRKSQRGFRLMKYDTMSADLQEATIEEGQGEE